MVAGCPGPGVSGLSAIESVVSSVCVNSAVAEASVVTLTGFATPGTVNLDPKVRVEVRSVSRENELVRDVVVPSMVLEL